MDIILILVGNALFSLLSYVIPLYVATSKDCD